MHTYTASVLRNAVGTGRREQLEQRLRDEYPTITRYQLASFRSGREGETFDLINRQYLTF